jgi:high affinity sulfate transporter 1
MSAPQDSAEGGPPQATLVPFQDAYAGRPPFASATKPPWTSRYLPLVDSMKEYSRDKLRRDDLAGVTVAALALPSSMAFAELAGLPVTAGLYALLLPVLAYALLGTGLRVVVGPEGAVALLVASALAPLAATGSAEYATLAAALAIAVGAVFLVARLVRLGWIADYFSQSVLVGYLTGVAILMMLGQVEKLTGLSSSYDGAVRATIDNAGHLGEASLTTVAVAACAFAVLFLFGHFLPRWPGALVVVVVGILASWLLDLEAHGVSVTGSIPAGLPSFARPEVSGSDWLSLALPAVAIFLVSFSDSILTSRSFAARHGETIDADQELLSFSAASVASGFTHGMPIGTSGSRTAVNDSMKATSQVSGLVSFATIVLILLFLTAPIRFLPTAILGTVIVYASLKLIDPSQWRELASSSRTEVAIAAITSVVVVGIGVLPAIAVAVVLSIVDVVRRTATPGDAVLGYAEREQRYADVASHPDAGVTLGIVVYRIQGRLFFANAHFFKRRLWAAVDGAPRPVHHLILDAAMISGIDASAVGAIREVGTGLHSRNITFEVARATDELREEFDATGLTELIGAEHFYGTVAAGVGACLRLEPVAKAPHGATHTHPGGTSPEETSR